MASQTQEGNKVSLWKTFLQNTFEHEEYDYRKI